MTRMGKLLGAAAGIGAGAGIVKLLRNPRWKGKLHGAADALHDTVLPEEVADRPGEPAGRSPVPTGDEAHAPGHRHLPPPPDGTSQPPRSGSHTVVDHHPGHVHKG